MGGDQAQLAHRAPNQLGPPPAGIAVAEAVEPVASQTPSGVPLVWKGVGGRGGRKGSVEGGVETGHLGQPRPQFQQHPHRLDRGRIVQRRQAVQPVESLLAPLVQEYRRIEVGAAMNDPMPDRVEYRGLVEELRQCGGYGFSAAPG